jgi:hypothetical protein
MRINEILTEAQMNPGIKKVLIQKGYKFLGHGQDQDAYIAPDGTILKIFGYERGSKGFSRSQQSFIDFANYCMKNPNNPFLPQFGGWNQFEFKGQRYLQIKCERLFEFKKAKVPRIAEALSDFVDDVTAFGPERAIANFLDVAVDYEYADDIGPILINLVGGEKELKLLAKTIDQLDTLADKKGYRLDLHSGNFMLGSDGEIVINDPFWTGSFR